MFQLYEGERDRKQRWRPLATTKLTGLGPGDPTATELRAAAAGAYLA